MSSGADGDKPLDPADAQVIARVRRLMLISGATTLVAVAAVVGVIGYRIYRLGGSAAPAASAAPAEVTALLPKDARVVSTAVAEDRIAVTIDIGGNIEIRTFDLKTLQPTGRLRLSHEP
ncbi:MAG TPA: hypothetical protein VH684_16545 [Xanthobacteraceae bacterium]|jgi:hypothetical protein